MRRVQIDACIRYNCDAFHPMVLRGVTSQAPTNGNCMLTANTLHTDFSTCPVPLLLRPGGICAPCACLAPSAAPPDPTHAASSACTRAVSVCTSCCAFFTDSIRFFMSKGLPPPPCRVSTVRAPGVSHTPGEGRCKVLAAPARTKPPALPTLRLSHAILSWFDRLPGHRRTGPSLAGRRESAPSCTKAQGQQVASAPGTSHYISSAIRLLTAR